MIQQFLSGVANSFFSNLNEIAGAFEASDDLEHTITSLSLRAVLVGSVVLITASLTAWQANKRWPKLKLPLFITIAGTMVITTIILIGSTVYLNVKSDSGGPVHWHADIEFWACGNELELIDPVGFSNKVGTWTLHEHDDHRIHLEGVVVDETQDASLGKFMHVLDGAITETDLLVPLNPDSSMYFENDLDGDGESAPNPDLVTPHIRVENDAHYAHFITGGTCGDQLAEVQTFVYNWDEATNTYEQTKLTNPQVYSITDDSTVPPGDCIIFEYDVPKTKTDKLCFQYGVRDEIRCEQFGVEPEQRDICNARQVNYDANVDYTVQSAIQQTNEASCGYQADSDSFQLIQEDCEVLETSPDQTNPDETTPNESNPDEEDQSDDDLEDSQQEES